MRAESTTFDGMALWTLKSPVHASMIIAISVDPDGGWMLSLECGAECPVTATFMHRHETTVGHYFVVIGKRCFTCDERWFKAHYAPADGDDDGNERPQ